MDSDRSPLQSLLYFLQTKSQIAIAEQILHEPSTPTWAWKRPLDAASNHSLIPQRDNVVIFIPFNIHIIMLHCFLSPWIPALMLWSWPVPLYCKPHGPGCPWVEQMLFKTVNKERKKYLPLWSRDSKSTSLILSPGFCLPLTARQTVWKSGSCHDES